MTAPIINGQAFGPSSSAFVSSVDITVTLGSNAGRWIRVKALSFDPFALGFGAGYISSAVLDPGGANVALTLDADHDLNGSTPSYGLGANGRIAWFRLDSIGTPSMPTGTVTLRVTMADSNGKPLVEAVWGDGCGVAGSSGSHSVGSGTSWASAAMTSTTNDLAVGIGFFDCGGTPSGAATITGTSSTAIAGSGGQTNYQRVFAASKSAVNPTLTATIGNNSFTPAWFGRAWVVQGAAAAPVLSAPTGSPTGPTQATIGVTSDTAPTTTAISYQILPAATGAPLAPTIVGAPDGTISTGSVGALTRAITALTTNAAVKVHFAQGTTSNVVSSASFTPNTLASSGSLSAQTAVVGGSITWAGVTPDSQITNHGNGSGSWALLSSAGFTVAPTCNPTTGALSGGTASAAGSYSPSVQYTDSSTVPSAQQLTRTISLTVSGGVFDAAPLAPLAINSAMGITSSVSAANTDFEIQPPIVVGNGTNVTLGISATLQFLSGQSIAPTAPLAIQASLGITAAIGFSNVVQLPATLSRARQYKVNPDEHLDAYAIQNQFVLVWEKDPDSVLDYSLDWSDWLAEIPDDAISSMSVALSSGLSVPAYGVVSGGLTAIMAAAGVVGVMEQATIHIVTDAGRVDERTIQLLIRQR